MKTFKLILVLVLWIGLLDSVTAQAVRKKAVEGNNLYDEEKFDQALNKYRDAQVHDPESALLKFNIGDAQYKMNKY